MFVEDAMTRHPRSVPGAKSVRDALRMLFEFDIRHLPVVDGLALIGMVSVRDLPALVPTARVHIGDPHEVEQALDQPISNLMVTDVVTVRSTTPLADAVRLMLDCKVGALPVIELEGRKLIGILSYMDALRVALPLL
jgi:acetoin utilization protein AcuB